MKFTQTITGNKRIKTLLESRKTEIFLVAVILLAAIFVRAYHFGAPPIGVHQDEAMAAVDAKALAEYGTDRYGMRYPLHFTAWKHSQMSVFLSYCMVPFIKILGFSTVTIRLPLLITSCLGLLALYLFTRQLAGKWTAMIALLFGMICPWHYMQSRWSIDCNMFPHMFLFAVCFLLAGLHRIEGKKWNRVFLYVSMVFFGLCCYCYAVSDYSVPVFLLAVAIYLLKKKQINWKEFLGCIAVYAVIVLPEYLSMLITVLGKETIETPLFTIPSFQDSVRGEDVLFANFSWYQLKENLVCMIETVFFGRDQAVPSAVAKFGPVYYVTDIFFLIGLITVIWNRKKKKLPEKYKTPVFILFAWMGLTVIIGAITRYPVLHRINIAFYPVIILAAVGMAACIQKWKITAIPIVALYGVLGVTFAATYFGEWADLSRIYYYEPYLNALDYAHTIECDEYYIDPDPMGEGEYMVGQILTMYSHQIDARYFQGVSNVQDGREQLPYAEKYHFEYVTEDTIRENQGKDVVYVVNYELIDLFDEEEYDITSFYNNYYVVEPYTKEKVE